MSNYTSAEITIATKELVDNTFILDWFKTLPKNETSAIESIQLSNDKTHIDIYYYPAYSFDIDEMLARMSKEFPNTFVTIGHMYSNIDPFTKEYLVVFKDGEIIVDEVYPHAVLDENEPFDKYGIFNYDEQKSEIAIQKLNQAKTKWFTTFDSLNDKNSNETSALEIIWYPNGEPEIQKKSSETRIVSTKKSEFDNKFINGKQIDILDDWLPF